MANRFRGVLGLYLLLAGAPAWAGAWTMEQGHGQLIVGGLLSQATEDFSASRGLEATPRYRKFEMQAGLEYGLSESFTLMFAPGYQAINIAPPIDASRRGFGYSEFGARYRFFQAGTWVVSGQVEYRAAGTNQASNPAAVGYTAPEVDVRALVGTSLTIGGMPAFTDLELAQRERLNGPPDELRFDATLGLQIAPRWLLMMQSFNVISEGAGNDVQFTSYDYSKLQFSTVYKATERLSLQLGGFSTVSGRNALQENGVIAAIWYKF